MNKNITRIIALVMAGLMFIGIFTGVVMSLIR